MTDTIHEFDDKTKLKVGIEVTPAMIEAGTEFAATTLQYYPIADFSIQLLVEGILRRAMAVHTCPHVEKTV